MYKIYQLIEYSHLQYLTEECNPATRTDMPVNISKKFTEINKYVNALSTKH